MLDNGYRINSDSTVDFLLYNDQDGTKGIQYYSDIRRVTHMGYDRLVFVRPCAKDLAEQMAQYLGT